MANVLVKQSYLEDIADAIRAKNGLSDTYKPSEMADAISDISGGISIPNLGSANSFTISELFNALATNTYSTGTVTVPSLYTANVEIEFCDTGFVGTCGGIVLFDLGNPSVSGASNPCTLSLGFFTANNSASENQTEISRGVWKAGTAAGAMFANSSYLTYRVNGGKLYVTSKYATVKNAWFMAGHTYRWIAWQGGSR